MLALFYQNCDKKFNIKRFLIKKSRYKECVTKKVHCLFFFQIFILKKVIKAGMREQKHFNY